MKGLGWLRRLEGGRDGRTVHLGGVSRGRGAGVPRGLECHSAAPKYLCPGRRGVVCCSIGVSRQSAAPLGENNHDP